MATNPFASLSPAMWLPEDKHCGADGGDAGALVARSCGPPAVTLLSAVTSATHSGSHGSPVLPGPPAGRDGVSIRVQTLQLPWGG